MPHRLTIVLVSVVSVLVSCSRCSLDGFSFSRSVSIMSYNVENLFDDRDDGTEFSDYDPGEGNWDTALYHAKLNNVSEAIRASGSGGPDICLLQEVENERVVTDLLEGYLNVLKYRYAVTAPKCNSATTVAFLSRFRPEVVLVHSIDMDDRVPLRPILEVWLKVHGDGLVLFNNHWKSKSEGARETEAYRLAAAALIRERIASIRAQRPDLCVIVAGDLNERVDEFSKVGGGYPTALMINGEGDVGKTLRLTGKWSEAGGGSSRLFSPWLDTSFQGSYVYAGNWEKIDHFLIARAPDGSGFSYDEFEVITEESLLDREGFPRRWNTRLADGYSDHLPILLKMKR